MPLSITPPPGLELPQPQWLTTDSGPAPERDAPTNVPRGTFPGSTPRGQAPESSAQAVTPPKYQPDPAAGPLGYPDFISYQRAYERARREAQFVRDATSQAHTVDEQLEGINNAMRFLSLRKLGKDVESGVPLPQALAANPRAWITDPKTAEAVAPILSGSSDPGFGQVFPAIDVMTGKRIPGEAVMRTGKTGGARIRTDGGSLSDSEKLYISRLDDERKDLMERLRRLEGVSPDDPEQAPLYRQYEAAQSRLSEINTELDRFAPSPTQPIEESREQSTPSAMPTATSTGRLVQQRAPQGGDPQRRYFKWE